MTEETLFEEALSRPAEERDAFLDQACAGRPELRAAVEALLAAHEKPGNPLDRPPAAPDPGATGEHTPQPEDAPPATTTDHRPDAAPGAVVAGRYTLVEKVGEGGMGEVWVAKQTEPVKRKVALKLIKAGMDSRAVVQRFEQERQALALMDHPNIARVLDGGLTPDRRPFFVMELVNGLPLTRFCDEARLGIRGRLELFAAICHAVQHAHQKGVVHRDLKPANILVTVIDGRGVPKVIDFGVAKAIAGRLTDESLSTQFGAVVGTLEYMSPEQAGFAGEDIDTRADIYSLGVILYELLTGLRPIDAKRLHRAAFAELIRIIQEEDPSRPSARLSTDASAPSLAALRQTDPRKLTTLLRGELDWVVMRCLEKRRDRRYETASGLARDVQRYLADEPVEARPPSAGYRLGKFLKRNRGPVVAAGLLLLALVGGIVGTGWGMIEARNKERAAADARNDLAKKNTDLEQSQAVIVGKNTELERSRDQLEGALARTWLSPLAETPGPLTDAEIGAFTEMSGPGNERLAGRFLADALGDRRGMRKLGACSAFALQAVAALDARKRQEVEGRLMRAFERPDLPEESRIDLALAASALGGLSPAATAVTARTLVDALAQTEDPGALGPLARGLSAASARLEPREAAAVLTKAMANTKDPNALTVLVSALSGAADRLEPREAAFALTAAMDGTSDGNARMVLNQRLLAALGHLSPPEAAEVAAAFSQTMTRANDPHVYPSLGLSALAPFLEPAAAASSSAVLRQAIAKTDDPNDVMALVSSLSLFAYRMEPTERARASAEAAAALTKAMTRTKDPETLLRLAQNLSNLESSLEPAEQARACAPAAALFAQAIAKTNDPVALAYLWRGRSVLAARQEPGERNHVAAEAAAALTQAMTKTSDSNTQVLLAMSMSGATDLMEPKDAVAMITQAMNKTKNPSALGWLAQGLIPVANRMDADEAAGMFSEAMTRAKDPNVLQNLAQGLWGTSGRMKPGAAAAALTKAMTRTDDPTALSNLGLALGGAADRLEPQEAVAAIAATMNGTNNTTALGWLAFDLGRAAERLEPREAARVCAEPAATLAKAMAAATADPKAPNALNNLSQGFSAVAAHLEPREGAAILIRAMNTTNEPTVIANLAQGIGATAARMDPGEAAEVATALLRAMNKTHPGVALLNLANALSATAAHMEPRQTARASAEAAAIIMRAKVGTQGIDYAVWALCLSAAAGHMEPREAARVSAEAAAMLMRAMSSPNNISIVRNLSEGLSAVATHLEPAAEAEAAAALTQAMTRTTDPNTLQALASALSAMLDDDRRLGLAGAAATVGSLHESQGLPGTLAPLQPTAKLFRPRPSDQDLVELLKGPLCVGPARRAILDHLEIRYGRPFADQWDFVRFAEEQKLGLDFTSPPKGP